MTFFILLSSILGFILFIICILYWKSIRPQKFFYDKYHQQNVPCEPFIPLVGQLFDVRRAVENDVAMDYRLGLVRKHGYTYVTSFGPSVLLMIMEPDMLADIFGRTHANDYKKTSFAEEMLKPLIGVHNLLTSDGIEHERARKMLNPAFHFVKGRGRIRP